MTKKHENSVYITALSEKSSKDLAIKMFKVNKSQNKIFKKKKIEYSVA